MKNFDHNTGQYFSIDKAKIYYEETGISTQPVLLMLHGGVGTIEDFNPILQDLFDNYRIIGIDSRGQGKSTTGNENLTYELLQNDVEALLHSLNIDSLSIIGFSDGGIVAYRLAAFSSLKIFKLVTIGSRWNINDTLLIKETFLKITPENWKQKFPETFTTYQKLNPEPNFNNLTVQLISMWLDPATTGQPNENIKKINVPLLIVRGDTDHLLSRKSAMEIAKQIKSSTLLNIPFADMLHL